MKYTTFKIAGMIVIAMVVFAIGCKKDPSQIGLGLQPPNDKIDAQFNDTSSVFAHSSIVDSIRSNGTPVSLLGSLADPVFGPTATSFSNNFRISSSAHDFGGSPVLDSLTLFLQYSGYYGSTEEEQTIRIYELTEQMFVDSAYYSNSVVSWSETLLAELSFVPMPDDSVVIGQDTLPPLLMVNLNNITEELGNKLLSASADVMSSNDEFSEFFYGLRIESDFVTSGGAYLYFDLNTSLSKMSIYYSNDEKDSISYDYAVNTNAARFGNFKHDYNLGDADFKAQINGDSTKGAEKIYIQPLSGISSKIYIPFIENWKDEEGTIAINEAKLIIEGYEDEPDLTPPTYAILLRYDYDGNLVEIPDQAEGPSYFGGFYYADSNQMYFRITNYVQQLIDNDMPNYGMELFVDGGSFIGNHWIMNGYDPSNPDAVDRKLRLEIVYTKIN